MKRLLNTSALFLAVVLCLLLASSGCRGWCASRYGQQTGTQPPEGANPSLATLLVPASIPKAGPPPVRAVAAVPAVVRPLASGPAANSGAEPYVVSRLYPCAECGVIRLDKTMPEEIEPNQPFDYYIKFTNLTDMALTGVLIAEDLSEDYKFTSSSPVARTQGNQLIWDVDLLEPRATKQITISGIATDGGYLKHCTTVLTQVIPACASMKVIQPKLEVTRISPSEVLLCDQIPVKFAVSNTGTKIVQDVKLVDTLPAGLQTFDGKNEITFNVGTLTPGQSEQYSVELRAVKTGKYAWKTVASSPAGPRFELANSLVVGQPVLAITQKGPEKHFLGRQLVYDITVANKGDGPARNTLVENRFPPMVTTIKATSGAKLTDSKVTWKIGTIPAGATRNLRVSYMPTKAGELNSTTTATAYCADQATATVKTSLSGVPGVLLEVGDIYDPVRIGDETAYVITVTNQGSALSTNIRITCTLEENVKYVSSSGATTGTLEGNTMTFAPLGSLAPKSKAAWQVVVSGLKAGDVRFKVTMNTDQLTRPVEETEATRVYE